MVKLCVVQVQRGYTVLEELEDALNSSGKNRVALLETLSARFYQVTGVFVCLRYHSSYYYISQHHLYQSHFCRHYLRWARLSL